MIISVTNAKGGSGKSTTVCAIAAWLENEGHSVAILDSDKQGSASDWASIRNTIPCHHYKLGDGVALIARANMLADSYDHVVIDVAGRENENLRGAVAVADLTVCPVRVGQADFWAFEESSKVIMDIHKEKNNGRVVAFLNSIHSNPRCGDESEGRRWFKDNCPMPLAEAVWTNRAKFHKGFGQGLSVTELGASKAKDEAVSLFTEIFR
jgi:chromosome partitioning protein